MFSGHHSVVRYLIITVHDMCLPFSLYVTSIYCVTRLADENNTNNTITMRIRVIHTRAVRAKMHAAIKRTRRNPHGDD